MKQYTPFFEDIKYKHSDWIESEVKHLSEEQLQGLYDVYQSAYAKLGMALRNPQDLAYRYPNSWTIDTDGDNQPDAFILYRWTRWGKKIVLMGSNGEAKAKKEVMAQSLILLKTKQYFTEVSDDLKGILDGFRIPRVKDEATVQEVTQNYGPISWIGNGEYTRHIQGIGKTHKTMFGYIRGK